MSIFVAIALLYFLDIVSPLPIQQPQSGPEYTGWEPQPRGRGSFGLIVNCLITLSLCVWTAVHLNVPARRLPTKTSRFARCRSSYAYTRLRWMFLGLLAPELAVYAAWRQWTSARILSKKMNELLLKVTTPKLPQITHTRAEGYLMQKHHGADQKDKSTLNDHSWTLVHGFYATMGGFVIDTYEPKGEEYIPNSPRITLTAKGVLFLAQRGYELPSMTKESILDRSKADGLAKGLVCLQAGYMIVQCAGRKAAGLPISLLEINTLGHVICALIMYLFWLQKPQDIHEPTLVDFEGIEAASAYMWMCSNMSETAVGEPREMSQLCYYPSIPVRDPVSQTLPQERVINPSENTEILYAETFLPSALEDKADPVPLFQRCSETRGERGTSLPFYEPPANSTIISENQYLRGSRLGPANAKTVSYANKLVRAGAVDRASLSKQLWQPTRIGLDSVGIRRWRLASRFISKHLSSLYLDKPYDPKDELNSSETVIDYRSASSSLLLLPTNHHVTGTEISELERGPIVFEAIAHKSIGYYPFLVINEVPNWPTSAGLLSGFQELPWIVISITTGLYGGLHATAWYDHFPSRAEQVLWCTSCVNIAASGILTGVAISMDRLPKKLGWWKPSNSKEYQQSAMLYYFWEHDLSFWGIPFWVVVLFTFLIVVVPAFLAVLLYIPARVFLVLEAFISLRNAPVGTYLTPDWTQWIPHL